MHIKDFAYYFYTSTDYYGIYINIEDTNKYCYSLVKFTRKKGKILISEYFDKIDDITFINEHIDNKKIPLFLNIDGKGILSKSQQLSNREAGIDKLLANVNTDEFFMQKIVLRNSDAIITTLIRQYELQKIINQFKETFQYIVNISIGPFNSIRYKSIFTTNNHLIAGDKEIRFENNIFLDFRSADSKVCKYNISGLEVSSKIIPLLTQLFLFLQNPINPTEQFIPDEFCTFRHYRFQTFKQKSLKLLAAIVLLILGLNYFSFNKLNKDIQKYSIVVEQYGEGEKDIDKIKKQIDFFKKVNSFNRDFDIIYSFYADRLGYTLPKNIALTNLIFNPVHNPRGSKNGLQFLNNTILITGTAKNSYTVNTWLSDLKSELWIKKIDLLHYKQNMNENIGEFELKIVF